MQLIAYYLEALLLMLTRQSLAIFPGWESFDSFMINTSEVLKNYFIFLLSTHRFNEFSYIEPTGLSYFIDVIARVFISYGIYQTIQAFRKFGRK